MIEWRRMAWSPGVISSHRSVPLWAAYSRGRFQNRLRSRVVRCCGQSSIVVMGWVQGSVRGLSCVFLWGWCLGHLFVRLLWGLRLLQFCADGGEDI